MLNPYYQTLIQKIGLELDGLSLGIRGAVVFDRDVITNELKKTALEYINRSIFSTAITLDLEDLKTPSDVIMAIVSTFENSAYNLVKLNDRFRDPNYFDEVVFSTVKAIVIATAERLGLGDIVRRILEPQQQVQGT